MIGVLVDGRYEVVKVLGGGAFGQTFLAKDTKRPGCPACVIKQLRYMSSNPQALQHARRLFKKEAEILEKLGHHDQIPTLLADLEEKQEFYLVEQFVPGTALSVEILPSLPWTEAQVIQLLREVLQVLVFVHGQGVIHRDIKPANLMRRQSDGKIVLIDFGAVKELETQIAAGQSIPTIAIGTPGYMAIEQFNGQPQFSSDLYALGMVAIQALLGLPAEALSGLRSADSSPPGEVQWRDRRSVSPEFAAVIDKLVRADHRQRYQKATEVLADLEPLAHSLGVAADLSETVLPASVETTLKSTILASREAAATPVQIAVPPTRPHQPRPRWRTGLLTLAILSGVAAIGFSQKGLLAQHFYNQGREKARYGDVRGALENYNRAIQLQPNYADAYARRCGTKLRLEDDPGAIEDCNRALQLDPNNSVAYLNWGNIYTEQRDKNKANQNYTRSIELSSQQIQLDPQNEDAYYYRGAARLRLADYRGAIEDATQAIQLDSEYADAYVTRCQATGLLGKHEQAIPDCQKATQINPNHYVGYTSLCNNFSNSGQYEAAIEACTHALQINPNDPHAYNNRGVIWFRMKNYQAAIEDYRQAIQRDAQDAAAYHNLGDALFFNGNSQSAIDAYTQAIQINPTLAAAYYSRGIRQAALGNIPEAVADLQQAADLYAQQGRKDGVEDTQYQIRRIQEGSFPTGNPASGNAIAPNPDAENPPTPLDPQPGGAIENPADPVNPVNPVDPGSPPPNNQVAPTNPVIQEPAQPLVEEPPAPVPALPVQPPESEPPSVPVVEEPPAAAPIIEEPPASILQEPAVEPYYEDLPYEEPVVEPSIEEPPTVVPVAPVLEDPSVPACAEGAC